MREIAREEADAVFAEALVWARKRTSGCDDPAPSPAEPPEPSPGRGADRLLACGHCTTGVYSHACPEHGLLRIGQGQAGPAQPAEAKGAPRQAPGRVAEIGALEQETDARVMRTLAELHECVASHDRDSRLLGNIRAEHICELLHHAEQWKRDADVVERRVAEAVADTVKRTSVDLCRVAAERDAAVAERDKVIAERDGWQRRLREDARISKEQEARAESAERELANLRTEHAEYLAAGAGRDAELDRLRTEHGERGAKLVRIESAIAELVREIE